ncbi:hypothetical protein MKMG_01139 [Methanogenium sp. MK-MG]|nr:hypothetical protein MKMG_01139 [Methanogenium sp. MK-MG]
MVQSVLSPLSVQRDGHSYNPRKEAFFTAGKPQKREVARPIVYPSSRARELKEPNYRVQPHNMQLTTPEKTKGHKPGKPTGEYPALCYKMTRQIIRHMATNHGKNGKNHEYYYNHHHG